MKLAFVVKLGWRDEYMFNNMLDAGAFAIQAATHRTDDSNDDPISISINKVPDESDEVKDEGEEVDDD